MIKKISKWNDERYEKIQEKELSAKTIVQVFGCGLIEGWIDVIVLIGNILGIYGYIQIFRKVFKK